MSDAARDALREGRALAREGRLAEAEAALRRSLELSPSAGGWNSLGVVLGRSRRHAEAAEAFRHAVEIEPSSAEFHANVAQALRDAGRLDEAISSWREAVRRKPDLAGAVEGLALALSRRGRHAEAEAALARAIALGPDKAVLHRKRGASLAALGRRKEAIACYRAATERDPADADAWYGLGTSSSAIGRHEDAAAAFRRCTELRPDDAESWYALGVASKERFEIEAAIAAYRRAIELRPDHPEAWNNLGNALKAEGRHAEAAEAYRRSIAAKPDKANAWGNLLFCLHYDPDVGPEEIAAAHRRYGERFDRPPPAFDDVGRDPERRLVVGYVSSDLAQHPIGWFLAGVLPNHDRRRVEVVAYNGRTPGQQDAFTARLRKAVDRWVDAYDLDDDALFARIRADRVDVLVDLAGHTRDSRILVFARKPAPVQVTWAGYVGTTGLRNMDWLLSDRFETPPGEDARYTERVWRMPNDYVCYAPPDFAPAVGPLPMVNHGFPTLGSANNLPKINDRVVDLWARVLREIPDARLRLKTKFLGDAVVRERLASAFADRGVSRDRLDLEGRSPPAELLGWYGTIDVALDPFPYSGGLTTLESLWMGVPVVTKRGDRFCARHSETHLSNVGLTELVADDADGYVATVKRLVGDPAALAGLRAGLRERMARSPVCDGAGFTRDLEAAYREMWRQWCGLTADG